MKEIYVVAHDGGCEGHSLPVLAFEDKETALRWIKVQNETYSVAAVPIYPEIPRGVWYQIQPEK